MEDSSPETEGEDEGNSFTVNFDSKESCTMLIKKMKAKLRPEEWELLGITWTDGSTGCERMH